MILKGELFVVLGTNLFQYKSNIFFEGGGYIDFHPKQNKHHHQSLIYT